MEASKSNDDKTTGESETAGKQKPKYEARPLNNLQRYYWVTFQQANDYLRAGRTQDGIDVLTVLYHKDDVMPLLAAWVRARLSLVIQEGWTDLREELLKEAKPFVDQCEEGGFNDEQVKFMKKLYLGARDKLEHDKELKELNLLPKPEPRHFYLNVTLKPKPEDTDKPKPEDAGKKAGEPDQRSQSSRSTENLPNTSIAAAHAANQERDTTGDIDAVQNQFQGSMIDDSDLPTASLSLQRPNEDQEQNMTG